MILKLIRSLKKYFLELSLLYMDTAIFQQWQLEKFDVVIRVAEVERQGISLPPRP